MIWQNDAGVTNRASVYMKTITGNVLLATWSELFPLNEKISLYINMDSTATDGGGALGQIAAKLSCRYVLFNFCFFF